MADSRYLTHKKVYGFIHSAVGERHETQPILSVFVYGGAAVAAGALPYAIAERPALLVRNRALRRFGEERKLSNDNYEHFPEQAPSATF
jgi:peptidoglycan/LPS O-acetylase OafA/YrhL